MPAPVLHLRRMQPRRRLAHLHALTAFAPCLDDEVRQDMRRNTHRVSPLRTPQAPKGQKSIHKCKRTFQLALTTTILDLE
eukprot:scaffold46776_cov15-Tisochrysis_lutea.AAC.1